MMRTSYVVASVIAVAASLYMASGFFISKDSITPAAIAQAPSETANKTAAPVAETLLVQTRKLKAVNRERIIVLRGKAIANREIDVRAKTSGTVDTILVEKGQMVKAGQELMTLTSEERKAKLDETKALLRQRQLEAGAQNTLAKKGFSSKMVVADAQAKLALAEAQTKAMEVEIDHLSVEAPADGILDRRNAEIGKYVAIGESVAVLVDSDPILAVGYATEHEVIGLSLGQKASVTFLDGEKREGQIQYIAAAADEETRTFRVEIAIANEDQKIRHGQSAEMAIPTQTELVQIIPTNAISLDSSGTFGIKVVGPNNVAQFLPAHIVGEDSEGLWLTGLPADIELIVIGQEFVRSGDKVTPIAEGVKTL